MRILIGNPYDVIREYNELEKKYGCARFRSEKGIYAVQSHVVGDKLYLIVYWR